MAQCNYRWDSGEATDHTCGSEEGHFGRHKCLCDATEHNQDAKRLELREILRREQAES